MSDKFAIIKRNSKKPNFYVNLIIINAECNKKNQLHDLSYKKENFGNSQNGI